MAWQWPDCGLYHGAFEPQPDGMLLGHPLSAGAPAVHAAVGAFVVGIFVVGTPVPPDGTGMFVGVAVGLTGSPTHKEQPLLCKQVGGWVLAGSFHNSCEGVHLPPSSTPTKMWYLVTTWPIRLFTTLQPAQSLTSSGVDLNSL